MTTPSFESLENRRYFNPAPIQPLTDGTTLTASDVAQIIQQAKIVSFKSQTVVVVDRDGNILGAFGQQPDATSSNTSNSDLGGSISLDSNNVATGALVEDTDAKYEMIEATRRARTVAFFESREDAFTTRTARFIIDDHFPEPIDNTEAGPLLGVEFSSEFGTDGLRPGQATGLANGLSGDPGGIPLFKRNSMGQIVPVGGIGVAGDGHDIFPRYDLQAPPGSPRAKSNPNNTIWNGTEENDFDEAVAVAGAQGFFAPQAIQSTDILVNGLRFPFVLNAPATGGAVSTPDHPGLDPNSSLPKRTWVQFDPFDSLTATQIQNLTASGAPVSDPTAFIPIDTPKNPYPASTILLTNGLTLNGQMKNNNPLAGGGGLVTNDTPQQTTYIPYVINGQETLSSVQLNPNTGQPILDPLTGQPMNATYGYIDSPSLNASNGDTTLNHNDVDQIIRNAATTADSIRAAIRLPSGVPVKVHIAVTDLQGNILGVFKMFDGTNFSFDVAIQKARTAAYFSSDTMALSARTVGFMADGQFPPAIENGSIGPLYQLQESLSLPFNLGMFKPTVSGGLAGDVHNPLANGITIFPGGAPLYKGGHLVGAIGISGDGVDQDDLICYAGTAGYRAPTDIQADHFTDSTLVPFLRQKVMQLGTLDVLDNPGYGLTFPALNVLQSNFGIIDPETASEAGNRDGLVISPTDTILDRIDGSDISPGRLLVKGLQGVQLPFQKFPRNPEL